MEKEGKKRKKERNAKAFLAFADAGYAWQQRAARLEKLLKLTPRSDNVKRFSRTKPNAFFLFARRSGAAFACRGN